VDINYSKATLRERLLKVHICHDFNTFYLYFPNEVILEVEFEGKSRVVLSYRFRYI